MSFKPNETNGYKCDLDLQITLHCLCVSYPIAIIGHKEKSKPWYFINLGNFLVKCDIIFIPR